MKRRTLRVLDLLSPIVFGACLIAVVVSGDVAVEVVFGVVACVV